MLHVWIRQMASGDCAPMREFYAAAKNAVYGYALSMLKTRTAAEEILRSAMLTVYRTAPGFTAAPADASPGDEAAERATLRWLLELTDNLCRESIRSGRNREAVGTTADKTEKIVGAEQNILPVFLSLPIDDRRLLTLFANADYSARQASEQLGLPLAAVLSGYNRAWKKLSELPGAEEKLPEEKVIALLRTAVAAAVPEMTDELMAACAEETQTAADAVAETAVKISEFDSTMVFDKNEVIKEAGDEVDDGDGESGRRKTPKYLPKVFVSHSQQPSDPAAEKKKKLLRKRLLLSAAILLLLLGTAFGIGVWSSRTQEATALFSVDMGPDVSFVLNRRHTVVEARALNAEAEELLEACGKLEGLSMSKCLNKVVRSAVTLGLIAPDETVLISSTEGKNGYLLTEVKEEDYKLLRHLGRRSVAEAAERLKDEGFEGTVLLQFYSNSEKLSKLAERYGITTGRAAFLLTAAGENGTVDELAELSAADIWALLTQAEPQP